MAKKRIAGFGRKRPQRNVSLENLYLDPENPRLPAEAQGGGDESISKVLYRDFDLDELAYSMAENGYFDEEPLVAIPHKLPRALAKLANNPKAEGYERYLSFIQGEGRKFTIVEGNRRLATAKLLLDEALRKKIGGRHWPDPSPDVRKDLSSLPVVVYPNRDQVVPYLGVRHIIGIQKWDSYARARYVAHMVRGGRSLEEIQAQIGDRRDSTRKNYLCYKILEQIEDEFGFDTREAKRQFSLLMLATGQGNIKRFIGLPSKASQINFDQPVPPSHLENLKYLYVWLFGNGNQKPVIRESRDITNFLNDVVESAEAVEYLKRTGALDEAFDRSNGEENMLRRYLAHANRRLETALGIAHRHRTPDVIAEVERCVETSKQLLRVVRQT